MCPFFGVVTIKDTGSPHFTQDPLYHPLDAYCISGLNLYPYIRLGPRWRVRGGRMMISMRFKRIIVFTRICQIGI